MAETSGARRVAVAIGTVFRGDWEIVEHIADGGSSSVYRARYVGEFRRHDFPEAAALKITVPLAPEERTARVREYDTAVRFRAHPSIVTAYEAFAAELEVGRCVVFVHELCEMSLAQRLRRGPLDLDDARRMAADLAAALASLHEAGVVHSDVKPANIMRVGGRWKLGDLGAAAHTTSATSTSAAFVGSSLPYSPPEQASELLGAAAPTTIRRDADVWAYGVVVHEAVTGHRPFLDAARQVEGIVSLDPGIPADLLPVIVGSLQRDRSQRLADGAAIVRTLAAASAESGPTPIPSPSNAPLPPPAAGDVRQSSLAASEGTSAGPPIGHPDPSVDAARAGVLPPESPIRTGETFVGGAAAVGGPRAAPAGRPARVEEMVGAAVAPAKPSRFSRREAIAGGIAALVLAGTIGLGASLGGDGASSSDSSPSRLPTTVVDSVVGTQSPAVAQPPSSRAGETVASVSGPEAAPTFVPTAGWAAADCTLPIVTSTEKARLMAEVVERFNEAAIAAGSCVRATAHPVTSGDATALLADGWPVDRAGAPRPVIWSPASRAWGSLVNHRSGRQIVEPAAASLMRSPVVIAMPRSVVDRLGIDVDAFGFEDLRALATADPEFALVRTYPQSSTSAVAGLVDQYYALGGASSSVEQRLAFNTALESANTRYRDNTLDVLEDLSTGELRLDAIVLEAKSVADYNRSDPRGVLEPGTISPLPPDPLVGILPEDGTVVSDHPLYLVGETWVSDNQRLAAADFVAFATAPTINARAVEWGFDPPGAGVPLAVAELDMPEGSVIEALQAEWNRSRKPLRLELLVDLSGSMLTDDRIGYAKQALLELVEGDLLDDRDEIGVRVFTTGLRGEQSIIEDLVAPAPFGEIRADLRSAIEGLRVVPNGDTPLYRAIELTLASEAVAVDGGRVSAIVVLSDGENDDPSGHPDRRGGDDLASLLAVLAGSESPHRVFTIAYGTDADATVLAEIAEASGARSYDARDVTKVASVLRQAVSNT